MFNVIENFQLGFATDASSDKKGAMSKAVSFVAIMHVSYYCTATSRLLHTQRELQTGPEKLF